MSTCKDSICKGDPEVMKAGKCHDCSIYKAEFASSSMDKINYFAEHSIVRNDNDNPKEQSSE